MVTTRMTEALPMIKPSAVRKLRNLLARRACRLNRSASPKYIRRRRLPGAAPLAGAASRLVRAKDRRASDRFADIGSATPWLDPDCASARCRFARGQTPLAASPGPVVWHGQRQLHFPGSALAWTDSAPGPIRGPLAAAPDRWPGAAVPPRCRTACAFPPIAL